MSDDRFSYRLVDGRRCLAFTSEGQSNTLEGLSARVVQLEQELASLRPPTGPLTTEEASEFEHHSDGIEARDARWLGARARSVAQERLPPISSEHALKHEIESLTVAMLEFALREAEQRFAEGNKQWIQVSKS